LRLDRHSKEQEVHLEDIVEIFKKEHNIELHVKNQATRHSNNRAKIEYGKGKKMIIVTKVQSP